MASIYGFRCGACGYTAKVSGGPDAGMVCLTQTVRCEVCRELLDVVVSDVPTDRPEQDVRQIRCEKCRGLTLKRWRHPGPCPKCGHRSLKRGELIMIWD